MSGRTTAAGLDLPAYLVAFPDLQAVAWERSPVVRIWWLGHSLLFLLDATQATAPYVRPASLDLRCSLGVDFVGSGALPAIGGDWRETLGTIDRFEPLGVNGTWELEGAWGVARVTSPAVTLRFY